MQLARLLPVVVAQAAQGEDEARLARTVAATGHDGGWR